MRLLLPRAALYLLIDLFSIWIVNFKYTFAQHERTAAGWLLLSGQTIERNGVNYGPKAQGPKSTNTL